MISGLTTTAEPASGRLPVSVMFGATLVMFLWAVCFPLISVGLSDSPPMTFAALRAALSGAALIIAAECLGRPPVADRAVWTGIIVVALTATSLGFFGMFYGGGRVSPGLATVIANVQPLIAAALAWGFLDEYLSVIQRWGLAAGFGGIVLIGAPSLSGTESQWFGIVLILLAAVAIAVSNVALKRLAGRVDILRAMGWQLLIGALPLAALAMTIEDVRAVDWSWQFMVVLLALSVFGTSAAFALWFSLLRRASLSQLNVFTFLTPIFGLVMGVALFAERLQMLELFGIALSLLGIYWVSRPPRIAAPAMPE